MRIRRAGAAVIILLTLTTGLNAPPAASEVMDGLYFAGYHSNPPVLEGFRPVAFLFWGENLPPAVSQWPISVTSTTDPAGIVALGSRVARNDRYYTGSFAITADAAERDSRTLLVADGDEVRMRYVDPNPGPSDPPMRTAPATWRATSAAPRHVTYENVSAPTLVVRGTRDSVAPGAGVRVYGTAVSGPLATGTARADGSFAISFSGPVPAPSALFVSAVESGLPESPRSSVGRSALTGRLLAPNVGDRSGAIRATFVTASNNADEGAMLTDDDGRFSAEPYHVPAGDLLLKVEPFQGDIYGLPEAPWTVSSYGVPPPKPVAAVEEGVTRDAGDFFVLGPNLVGHVVDENGFDIAEAQITDEATWNQPGRPVYTVSRADGRFGLHLEDGTYHLTVSPPFGCYGTQAAAVDVTVVDGVTHPSRPRVVLHGEDLGAGVDVPIAPVAGTDTARVGLTSLGEDVDLTLTGVTDRGRVAGDCPGRSVNSRNVNIVAPGVDLRQSTSFDAARVCLPYDQRQVQARGLAESQLDVLHWPDGAGVRRVTLSRDVGRNIVCGRSGQLGTFAVGVRLPRPILRVAASRQFIAPGEQVAFRGRLLRPNGTTPIPRTVVALRSRLSGSHRWSTVAVRRTDEAGRVVFRREPSRSRVFRLRFDGNLRWAPTRSADVTVKILRQ